jgi:hypothetical protein
MVLAGTILLPRSDYSEPIDYQNPNRYHENGVPSHISIRMQCIPVSSNTSVTVTSEVFSMG